ncbi:hypothetical protein DH2020_002690 [Rehmannia glutinosa]|uniref:DC1 domain-containing protein n=1 Tax=Rehmannia glutinosa TaxID=99300 RepID=A0ABR0XUQ3_REHGL
MKHEGKQHFSHEHLLIPIQRDDEDEEIQCKTCKELIEEESFHGCPACEFCLHEICLEAPRSMVHPSHPSHPLALLPTPTYPNRFYGCNACGLEGKGFSFSCAHCEYDLHLTCAILPETGFIEEAHPHEIKLVFEPPCKNINDVDQTNEIIACDICGLTEVISQGYWFYYCEACEFVVHITCLFLKLGNKETSAESSDEVSVKEGEGSSGDGKQEPVGSSDEEDDNEEDSDEDVVRVLRYVLSAYANTLVLEDTPDD